MSRLLSFPCRTLEELRAAELAILEDLAETRRRIVECLESEAGSERKRQGGARGGPQETRERKAPPALPLPFRSHP